MSSRRGRSRRRSQSGAQKQAGQVEAGRTESGSGGRGRGKGGGRAAEVHAAELWRAGPALPEPQRIRPAGDPTALVRSLGNPPLRGQSNVAEQYLAAVVERASDVATALAASAGLLADDEADGAAADGTD